MSLVGAHVSGFVNLHSSKASSVNMQHLAAEALDIHECEVDKLVIAQAKNRKESSYHMQSYECDHRQGE